MRYKAKEMINASLRIPEKGIFAEKKNTWRYKNSTWSQRCFCEK